MAAGDSPPDEDGVDSGPLPLGACWARGSHSFFPWRWVKKRLQYERACKHCGGKETATAETMDGAW